MQNRGQSRRLKATPYGVIFAYSGVVAHERQSWGEIIIIFWHVEEREEGEKVTKFYFSLFSEEEEIS